MRENEEATIDLFVEATEANTLNRISCDVTRYRGKLKDPRWMDLEPGRQLLPIPFWKRYNMVSQRDSQAFVHCTRILPP